MKTKITLAVASAFLWLSSALGQAPCANDLNGFVSYKNVAGTGLVQLKMGFEEKAAQTYNYSGPGKVTGVKVYGNYPVPPGFPWWYGGVPLKIGVYNVDASGRPTTPLATTYHTWWSAPDNLNGFIYVTFPGGVTVNNRFAITVEVINAFPYGTAFNLQYTGNGEGGFQDLASLAGTSTGNNWSSAMVSFGKNGDFYLEPKMAHLNVPNFSTTNSSCYAINSPVSFTNTTQMTKDSMFNKIAFPNYAGPNYFYTWNFGDLSPVSHVMNPTHTYTAGGVYTTTLTTTIEGWASTCVKTVTKSVSVGLNVSATSITSVTCFGGNNGSVVANGQFGAPTYSYNLNGGSWQTSQNFNGLYAGNYTMYVKDTKGCINTTNFTINQPTGISISSIFTTNSNCGSPTGGITSTATGGVPPLQYKLDLGSYQANGNFSALMAGTHSLVVKDANTCTVSSFVIVNDLGGPSFGPSNVTNVSCNGGNDGSITLTSTGGIGLIQYSIDICAAFQTSGSFTNVTAGFHSCIVKDNAGCTDNLCLFVSEGPALGLSVSSIPALCNGASNGQINAASTGGTGNHIYSINGNVWQAGTNFSGLPAGNYTVYVEDVTSCIKTATISVTEPAAISPTLSSVPATCNGLSNGAITAIATGGDGNYCYSIDGINFQGTGTFTNFPAGTYTVTVKDLNNCIGVASTFIGQPPVITTTINTTNSTCTFTNGSIMVLAAGGSGSGYQFSNNGGANFFASGLFTPLPAGTQYVIVKDGSGCQITVSGIIVDSNGPVITASSQQNVSCNGGNDGTITIITVTGGTGLLQYSKNGINWQISPVFTGLQAGTYVIQVKDANGCTGTDTKILTQPNPFLIATAVSSVACAGNATGSSTITASGGAGFLVFSINGGNSFQASTIFNGLTAAIYTVIVKDAANCTGTSAFTILQPPTIAVATGSLDVSCYGANNGAINVSASGGVSPYLYSINAVTYLSVGSFTGLPGNYIYTIYVKDANNCIVSPFVLIHEPSLINVSAVVNNINCFGGNNGAISLNTIGGTPLYTYQWSNNSTAQSLFNLTAGVYNVDVTDQNGCNSPHSYTLTQPANPLIANAVITIASGNSSLDGVIDITVTGGVGPYTYTWSNGATTEDISGLNPGAYMVTITDANGCSTSSTYNVGNITGIANIQVSSGDVRVYPNPANEYITIEAQGFKIDKVELINLLGQKVFESEVNSSSAKINTTGLVNGTYFVKIYTNNGSVTKKMNIVK